MQKAAESEKAENWQQEVAKAARSLVMHRGQTHAYQQQRKNTDYKWRNEEILKKKIRNSQIQNNSSKWGDPDCFPLVSRGKLGGDDQLDKSETFSCGKMQTTRIYADLIVKVAYFIEYHF